MSESTAVQKVETGMSPFDRIKQVRPDGTEFWSARALQALMGYARWANMSPAIARAQQAASNTGMDVAREFSQVAPAPGSRTGSGQFASGSQEDFELSRQAAYLVAMNGDPNKTQVAAAQGYFVDRTTRAEQVEQRAVAQPSWAMALHALVDQQAETEVRLQEVTARVGAIEGAHDWFSALAYAINNSLPTERGYLQRVGVRAGRVLREDGQSPGKTQHPAFGTVNTYPAWALERGFAEMPEGS